MLPNVIIVGAIKAGRTTVHHARVNRFNRCEAQEY
jgi:hypothetical protein